MTTINEILKRAIKAEQELPDDIKLAVKLIADDLINLNREDQLFEGIGSDGNIIGVYSRATEEMTQGLTGPGYPKRAGDPFNFYDTGGVFKRFTYRFKDDSKIELFSTDSKVPELLDKYPNMFNLTPENEEKFNYKLLVPVLRGVVKRHFKGI